LDRHKY